MRDYIRSDRGESSYPSEEAPLGLLVLECSGSNHRIGIIRAILWKIHLKIANDHNPSRRNSVNTIAIITNTVANKKTCYPSLIWGNLLQFRQIIIGGLLLNYIVHSKRKNNSQNHTKWGTIEGDVDISWTAFYGRGHNICFQVAFSPRRGIRFTLCFYVEKTSCPQFLDVIKSYSCRVVQMTSSGWRQAYMPSKGVCRFLGWSLYTSLHVSGKT